MRRTSKPKAPRGIKNWAEDDRPREKMMQKGYAALSNAELIAILIQSGNKEKNAVELARELLKMSNYNLSQMSKLAIKDFQKVKGIGEVRAITVAAALELGRRRQLSEAVDQKVLGNSKAAADLLVPLMSDLPHEHFCVLCLTAGNKLLHYEFVSSGGLTSTVADPRVIFKIAIQHMASRIIIAHNHPSGNLRPSISDKTVTEKIKNGALMLDMRLVDHLIIADNKYLSFADEGML